MRGRKEGVSRVGVVIRTRYADFKKSPAAPPIAWSVCPSSGKKQEAGAQPPLNRQLQLSFTNLGSAYIDQKHEIIFKGFLVLQKSL